VKRVEFWKWRVLNERGKVYTTLHRMTVDEALQRHPEAVRVEGSCEVRELPETDEERGERIWSQNSPRRPPE
jgi:hypothetical protein